MMAITLNKPEYHAWATSQFDRGWNAGIDAAYKYHFSYIAEQLEKDGYVEAANYLRSRSEQL